MKIITKEEQDAQQRATIAGGVKGFLGGSAVALPASFILHQRWPYYRALPPSLKALGVIMAVVPSFVISAEHAGHRHEREQWSGIGKEELDIVQTREQQRWNSLSFRQKVNDLAVRHEYGIILSAWAICLAGSFGIIMRNKYQTLPQKVVQARMWAQGLTIGVLIAGGLMTHSRRAKELDEGPVRHLEADHSWKDAVELELQEEKARAAAKVK